ncbi:hypothetical protein V8G54_027804 [Vigna mungo]|uniref:FRIGIDA-like protein n=1 Tax=Vigna mungo TaxID=3915 RepID=A0AAQ3RKC3_VIGMU
MSNASDSPSTPTHMTSQGCYMIRDVWLWFLGSLYPTNREGSQQVRTVEGKGETYLPTETEKCSVQMEALGAREKESWQNEGILIFRKPLPKECGDAENVKTHDIHTFLQHVVTFGIVKNEDLDLCRKLMTDALNRVIGVEVVATSSLAQKIGSFSVLSCGVVSNSLTGSMTHEWLAAATGAGRGGESRQGCSWPTEKRGEKKVVLSHVVEARRRLILRWNRSRDGTACTDSGDKTELMSGWLSACVSGDDRLMEEGILVIAMEEARRDLQIVTTMEALHEEDKLMKLI